MSCTRNIQQRVLLVISVDGGWGEWGSWSSCSVACGDGFRTRERPCDDPLPQNGGDDCEGRGLDAILCNEGECVGKLTNDIKSFMPVGTENWQ